MKRILITGGAGFIGYHLARYLLAHSDAELVLADNLQRGRMDDDFQALVADPRAKFLNIDLTDPAQYRELGRGYDHVYHLAAINGTRFFYEMPHEVLRVNTLTLLHMLEWFRRENPHGQFCFPSSNEVYAGALESFGRLPIPTPELVPHVISDAYNPRWSYAATKLWGELAVINYAKHHGFRALVIRPHNFYGPRAGYDHVIPQFAVRIAKRTDPFPIHGADDTRTFCYIEDAVRAMAMLMASERTDGQPIETVHIGDSREIAIRDLAEELFSAAGWRPNELDVRMSPEGSVKRRRADTAKLEQLVGWKPEVALADGLRRTYQWYASHPE